MQSEVVRVLGLYGRVERIYGTTVSYCQLLANKQFYNCFFSAFTGCVS